MCIYIYAYVYIYTYTCIHIGPYEGTLCFFYYLFQSRLLNPAPTQLVSDPFCLYMRLTEVGIQTCLRQTFHRV